MINNIDIVKGLLQFDEHEKFYFIQVIQRKKDIRTLDKSLTGSNNSSRLIKAYYIYSMEQFDKQVPEMIQLATLFNARVGINLNRRCAYKMSLEMMEHLATNIKNHHYTQLHRLYNTVCGKHHAEEDKLWVVDIDHKNMRLINSVVEYIDSFVEPKKLKVKAYLETNSGYHLITTGFNTQKFKEKYPEIEVHKNNPTALYYP